MTNSAFPTAGGGLVAADANPTLADKYKILGYDAAGVLTKYAKPEGVYHLMHTTGINVAANGFQKTAQYQTGPFTYVVAHYLPWNSVPATGQQVIDSTTGRYVGHRIAGWGGQKDVGRDVTWQNLVVLPLDGPMNVYIVDALQGPDPMVFWIETVKIA